MNKSIPLYCNIALVGTLAALGTANAQLESTTFGSDFDGVGGYTQSTFAEIELDPVGNPGVFTPEATWTTELDSVRLTNLGPPDNDGGTRNSSLLKEVPFTRAAGLVYNMTATIVVSTYAADNNRAGIYLFGDSPEIPGDAEAGAIAVHMNFGQNSLNIAEGIGNVLASTSKEGTNPYEQGTVANNTVSAYELDFDVTWTYLPDNQMIIDVTMTDPNDVVTSTSTLITNASSYAGNYFGFISRHRVRGDANRTDPFIMDAVNITVDNVPQASLLATDNAFIATPNASDEIVLTFDIEKTTSLDVDFSALDLTGASATVNPTTDKVEVSIPGITDSSLFLKLSGAVE